MKRKWNDYLWIASLSYLILGFVHILFAWLGLICFAVPLLMAFFGKEKAYCNRYCGRGQLLELLGKKFHLSSYREIPRFLRSKWFRYGFLIFFMAMFFNMLFITYLVFQGTRGLKEAITILWMFRVPWGWIDQSQITPWIAQFAFGFYSVMLTSTILGIVTMFVWKPRSWCVYCPMGTMTQGICQLKNKGEEKKNGRKSEGSRGTFKGIGQ